MSESGHHSPRGTRVRTGSRRHRGPGPALPPKGRVSRGKTALRTPGSSSERWGIRVTSFHLQVTEPRSDRIRKRGVYDFVERNIPGVASFRHGLI